MSKNHDKPQSQSEHVVKLPKESDDLVALLERTDAERPSEKDREALRVWLKKSPELVVLLGDVSSMTLNKMVIGFAKQGTVRESVLFQVEQIKKEMGRAQAPMLEKLLIDQIALCWADFHIEQYRYTAKTTESHTREAGEYWVKRLNAAQGRYLRACETLARVRRLSRPAAMQVNIGAQQVNVAQGADPKQSAPSAPVIRNGQNHITNG